MSLPLRRISFGGALVCVTAMLTASPAKAGFPVQQEMTCAVGGEEFTFTTTGSYSTFGSRPDGKPYGSWTFPLALPDCPGNGLIMYRDFEEAEVAALSTYLASPEFARIRGESEYYRAASIAAFLEDGLPYVPVSLMLRASWEVDFDADLKRRYQREFAEQVATLPTDQDSFDWIAYTARAANAWRELGDFDKAAATLALLPIQIAPPEDARPNDDDDYSDAAREIRNRVYMEEYRTQLSAEIAAKNDASEPLKMMSERYQVSRCLELQDTSDEPQPALCQTPKMLEEIERIKKLRAEFESDASAIAEAAEDAAVE